MLGPPWSGSEESTTISAAPFLRQGRLRAARQPPDSTLEAWAARLQEAMRAAAFRGLPRLAGVALEIESRRLRSHGIPHLFASDLVSISPTLNDDLLELYGRSEQVLANRFGFFGSTEDFSSRIDWDGAPGISWQAELHSFDYALDVGLTFRISGEARYARHLRYLLADWIAGNLPGRPPGWRPLPLARRIRNWILAADLARDGFAQDEAFQQIFNSSLAQQVTYLSWQVASLNDRRARLMSTRALLLASRYFSGNRAVEVGELARALLVEALDEGPASFSDHPLPLRQFELASACLDQMLFADADWARKPLEDSLQALEGMLHPDSTLPIFGREPLPSPDAITTLFALGAALLGVPRWKSLAGDELGILPYMLLGEAGKRQFDGLPHKPWAADSRLQSESGIYRVGNGKSSAMLICGLPPSSVLDHQDAFSYELTVCGQRAVVDAGIFRPADGTDEDVFASAASHNVLLVDAESPDFVRNSHVRCSPMCSPDGVQGVWLSIFRETRSADSDKTGAHSTPEQQRGYFLIEKRIWVVLDYIPGIRAPRLYTLIHFYPAFALEVRGGVVLAQSGALSVTILPLACGAKSTQSVAKCKIAKTGWYAPTPGVRYPSQVLEFEWTQPELPGVFGYCIENESDTITATSIIERSEGGVRLAVNGREYYLEFPKSAAELR